MDYSIEACHTRSLPYTPSISYTPSLSQMPLLLYTPTVSQIYSSPLLCSTYTSVWPTLHSHCGFL